MLRGFLAGTLTLIVLYVVVQPGSAAKSEQAGNVLVAGMKRLLSPTVAGIGAHSGTPKSSTTAMPTAAAPSNGIYFQNL